MHTVHEVRAGGRITKRADVEPPSTLPDADDLDDGEQEAAYDQVGWGGGVFGGGRGLGRLRQSTAPASAVVGARCPAATCRQGGIWAVTSRRGGLARLYWQAPG